MNMYLATIIAGPLQFLCRARKLPYLRYSHRRSRVPFPYSVHAQPVRSPGTGSMVRRCLRYLGFVTPGAA